MPKPFWLRKKIADSRPAFSASIHPDAIKEFLGRKLDSHIWVKELDEKAVDAALLDLGFEIAAGTDPLDLHQKACILLALAFPQFAFWLDMGTGKTRLMLEWFRHMWRKKEIDRGLVLAPSEQSVNGWEKQIKDWKIGCPYVALGNSPSDEKWQSILEMDDGLIVMTYPGLAWLLSKKMQVKGSKKLQLKLDPKMVNRMRPLLQGQALIMDESTEVGNQGSLYFRAVRSISKAAEYRYALAGRPFGRDPSMVWSQQWLVDHGETLGETLGLFRAAFFYDKRNHFGGFDYTFKKEMQDDLAEMMMHRSITYASSECLSLPPVTPIIERIRLPEDIEAYRKKAKEAIIFAKGDPAAMDAAFLRMRQLSSGFIGYRDAETQERAKIVFPINPKLERMLELIREVPLDRKFVIFHQFIPSGQMITEALDKLKIKHGWLRGGIKNSKELQERFDTDPKMRGMIVNNELGAMSLNLQVANYTFIFEAPVSPIAWEQLCRRTDRKGQKWPGFRYDLRCIGTMDDAIRGFHEEGDNLFAALLRAPYDLVA